jgi:hypothetical protein
MSEHPRATSSVMATCPECGLGARVSGHGTRVDDNRCELLTGCTPLSCTHFTDAIAAAQELLRKLSASEGKPRVDLGERQTPPSIH